MRCLNSHTPDYIVRLPELISLVTGIATFFHEQLCHFNTQKSSNIRHSERHFGDLIRLCVHQVNNELCIIVLPWCNNNGNCLIPNKLKSCGGWDLSSFSEKMTHLSLQWSSVSPEWQKHAGNTPVSLIALGEVKSDGGFKMPTLKKKI